MAEQKLIPKEFIKESSTVFKNTKEIKAVLDSIKREVASGNFTTPVTNGSSNTEKKIAHKIATIKVYNKNNKPISYSKTYNETNTLKAKEEVTYIVKLTGEKDIKDKTVFDNYLKKVKFYFWVQDKNGKRIEITTPTKTHSISKRTGMLTSDRATDIFELRHGETINANIQQSAYFYATRVTYDLEKKEARLTVKWSKWMDGYMTQVEATQGKILADGGKTSTSRYVQAQPEILKGYWVNEKRENIDNIIVGYKNTVYMCLKTLGMTGQTVTTQLWEEGVTFMGSTISNDEKLCMNENIEWKLEERWNYKKLVIPNQSTEEYKEQREQVWEKDPLDIYFSIPSEKDTEGYKTKFGDILKLSVKEQIVDAYFAKAIKNKIINDGTVDDDKEKKNNPEQQTVYERIDSSSLGSEVYLVVETTNIHGKNLTLKIFDNEKLLAKDDETSIKLLYNDTEVYKLENVKADAKTGKAIVKVKLRPKSNQDYKKLKDKFKDDKIAKLFIGISYINSAQIPQYKTFLDDEEFEVKRSDTIYIYHSGHITKIDNLLEKEKISYVYIDKNNKQHDLGSFDIVKVQKWKKGSSTANSSWKKVTTKDKNKNDVNRYYMYDTGEVPLIKIKFPISYDKNGVKIKINDNTDREYMNPEAYACLLGALAENDYKDMTFNGFTSKDGTGAPSVSHYNGIAGDFRYLRKDKKIASLHINTKPDDLDVDRTEKFIDALIKFGWGSFYSFNIILNKKSFRLKKDYTTHLGNHHHHLHLRKESFKPNYK